MICRRVRGFSDNPGAKWVMLRYDRGRPDKEEVTYPRIWDAEIGTNFSGVENEGRKSKRASRSLTLDDLANGNAID